MCACGCVGVGVGGIEGFGAYIDHANWVLAWKELHSDLYKLRRDISPGKSAVEVAPLKNLDKQFPL